MWRNCAAAALRNLASNRFYVAVGVVGLAVGLAAALLTALFIRNELSFDSFVPGAEDVYVVTSSAATPGQAPLRIDYSPFAAAEHLRRQPGLGRIARLAFAKATLAAGEVEAREDLAWVDADFFRILPTPAVAGSPAQALEAPDAVVVTRSLARKYFGRDAPLGETLQLDGRHSLRIGAVIEDLPPETHLTQEVFGSARAPFSTLAQLSREDGLGFLSMTSTATLGGVPPFQFRFVRVRLYAQAADPAAARRAADALSKLGEPQGPLTRGLPPESRARFELTPLRSLHLEPFHGANVEVGEPQGSRPALYALAVTALLVVGVAVVNFVNLTTARIGRRSIEVGVRKAAGAGRRHLAAQFLGEAVLQCAAAMVLALALVELALPPLNAFLGRSIDFPYWREPGLVVALALTPLALALLAGGYPALVASSFRPAAAFKGLLPAADSGLVRQALVVFQLTVLTLLLIATVVVWRQARFSMDEGLRLAKDHVLVVHATPCRGAFADAVRRIPGVRAAACSSPGVLGLDEFDPTKYVMDARTPGGPEAHTDLGLVDFGFFELYGLEPLAGRVFSRQTPGDELPLQPTGGVQRGPVLVNESAARRLGFRSAAEAVDRPLDVGPGYGEFVIVGVVPDITLDLANAEVKPTVFLVDFLNYPAPQILNVKIDGRRAPETLAAIDAAWRSAGQAGAIRRELLDDYLRRIHTGSVRQASLAGGLTFIALLLSCVGLLGLAAHTAERRTKEIGVRKALGASTGDILRLLIWRFSKPVLWANLAAAPIGFLVMNWWLEGFAYRASLSPWLFAGAAAATFAITWATVFGHALRVARRPPVHSLRYE